MTRIFFTLLFLCVALPLSAHEFWLKPAKFKLRVGETTMISMRVGENFTGELWKFNQSRVIVFAHCHKNETLDIAPVVKDSVTMPIELTFKTEGTHLVAFHSTPKFIELDAKKFSEYLKEDGLDEIIALREKRGETEKSGREQYRRCAKTVVQTGDVRDETFSRVMNFPLEIVPEQNPYSMKSGDAMGVKILFNGKPLANALARTWHNVNGKVTTGSLRTDNDGRTSFKFSAAGEWMISLVKMIEAADKSQSDYESFWASLTFGFDS
jgi:uncharacterized GH25 family protein